MLFNYCILFICLQAFTTCLAKTDVVTEPTPAGTGVIIEALSTQSSNLTSVSYTHLDVYKRQFYSYIHASAYGKKWVYNPAQCRLRRKA